LASERDAPPNSGLAIHKGLLVKAERWWAERFQMLGSST